MGLGHRQVLRVLSVCARSSRADVFVWETSRFRARHSGVSNPSLCPGFRGVGRSQVLRLVLGWGFRTSWAYDSLDCGLILVGGDNWVPLFTPCAVNLGFLYDRGGWHKIYQPWLL